MFVRVWILHTRIVRFWYGVFSVFIQINKGCNEPYLIRCFYKTLAATAGFVRVLRCTSSTLEATG